MDSENGRMTREEYRAQMGLDAEPITKCERAATPSASYIAPAHYLRRRRRSDFRYMQAVSRKL